MKTTLLRIPVMIVGSLFLALCPPSFGHPPKTLELLFDSEKSLLTVKGEHSVSNPQGHRISQIRIFVNGKQVADENYDRQIDEKGYQETFQLKGLSPGDTIEAKVTCNKFGSKKGSIVVKEMKMALPTYDKEGLLKLGTKAPAFSLKDENGQTVKLEDFFKKKNVVLIFYPGDSTPGCTKQLCAVRDDFTAFTDLDTVVFGVNPQTAASHKKFVADQSLPFPLLVDEKRTVSTLYGAGGAPVPQRTVYSIDKEGNIVFAERGMPAHENILAPLKAKKVP